MKNTTLSISMIFISFLCTAAPLFAAIPRPEHPRPDFYRDAWINLNGEWNFSFDPDNKGEDNQWFKPDKNDWPNKVTVPYPWESPLSGIENPEYQGTAWYQRSFTIPDDWKKKQIFIHFCAVDWYAKVWVDGKFAGEHEGGYTPFSFPIHDLLSEHDTHIVTVKATDTTSPEQPVGKQIGWYTRTSGIWQTVYLEAVGKKDSTYIKDVKINADPNGEVAVAVTPSRSPYPRLRLEVFPDEPMDNAGQTASIAQSDGTMSNQGTTWNLKLQQPQLWSPQSPTLYFIKVNLYEGNNLIDTIHTYFGIRKVSRRKYAENPFEYIFLNGKPFYILSALDQAFHPDGIHTYPTDELIRQDIEDSKQFGFNNLRLHIKVDEPRFYYWADRLGVSVLYDLPCFRKYTEDAKRRFTETLKASIQRDKNHPSILAWVLFNETWGLQQHKTPEGQAWVKDMVNLTKQLDPTRLVEDNSPNKRDHVLTDINSWHFYIHPHQRARDHIKNVVDETYPGSTFNYIGDHKQGTEPLINSEYGGVSAGMGDRDIAWCFHYLTQELRRHPKIGGYVYTELQDIEWEHNGFMNYDRSKKVFGYEEFVPVPESHPPFTYRDLNTSDFLILDAIAGENISNEKVKNVPVSLSLYSGKEDGTYNLHWQLHMMSYFNPEWQQVGSVNGPFPFEAKAYSVSQANPINFEVRPNKLYLLYAWVTDSEGKLVARNFWSFHSLLEHKQKMEMLSMNIDNTKSHYIPWHPTQYDGKKGELEKYPEDQRESVSIPGIAAVTYSVQIPNDLNLKDITQAYFMVELSACAGIERVDWKERIRTKSTPQTDVGNLYPSNLDLMVNGESIATISVPNDPADYRGILSNIFNLAPPSSYGYLQKIEIPLNLIKKQNPVTITIKTRADNSGLRIFGGRSGRYPVPPTLIFQQGGKE